jgi:hypothetical protein
MSKAVSYGILDSNGYLVSIVTTDEPIKSGWVVLPEINPPRIGLEKLKYVNGAFIPTGESWLQPSVSLIRANEYPSIGDQLGALWKALAPLIEHPEAQDILQKIQAVKDAHPK